MNIKTSSDHFRAGVLAERRRILSIVTPLELDDDVQTKIESIFNDKLISDMFESYMRGETPFKLS